MPSPRLPVLSRSRGGFLHIGIALVLAIGAGDGLILAMERHAALASRAKTTTQLVQGMGAQTAHIFGRVDDRLKAIASEVAIGGLDDVELAKARLRAVGSSTLLMDRRARLEGVDALMLVDAEGVIAGLLGSTRTNEAKAPRLDFLTTATAGESGPFVSAPERDPVRGAWTVLVARRLTTARGEFAGAVLARLSLADLLEFYRVAMPNKVKLAVATSDGTLLVEFPNGLERTGLKVPGLAAPAKPSERCVSYHGPDRIDGAPVVAAICGVDGFPLVFQASSTIEDVLEGGKRERLWLVVGGAVAATLAIGLLALFARQVRRLEASEASLAVEKGHAERDRRHLDIALSHIPQGVCLFDGEHRLIVSNGRYAEIYGLSPGAIRPGSTLAEILDLRWASVGVRGMDKAAYMAATGALARDPRPRLAMVELTDGRTIATRNQPMPDGGWVATHEDITERRSAENKIAFLAKHDPLTGLANRTLLTERITRALDEAARGSDFAILFLDLDRFKGVNDTLGHDAGDELLRQVAARLSNAVDEGSTIARLGGDEFVVLQTGVKGPEDAAKLAARLVKRLGAPYRIGPNEIVIGASVGVDISTRGGRTADGLLKNADIALYMAKSQGRGVFRFFEADMDSTQRRVHKLESELKRAVAENQFELQYQPVVAECSGEVTAFEALLRWRHPERGLLAPEEFIPGAEDSGLIIPIGEWVIQQTCWQATQWPSGIGVSFNLSTVQFRSAGLVPVIRETLEATGLAPNRLELEITESALSQSGVRNLGVLHQLRELGVRIAMDDFGAGYSSMSYLRKFRFDRIKIDRSFITDLASDGDAVYFVRAIIALSRNLDIRTTAEGVETFDQLSILHDEGCTELQGHLFGKPGSAGEAADFIARGRLIPS
jgi:diguanylate cyclase (GGDEF)-like protein